MNMVGSPKHVEKALAVGVDAVCAQGTEAGGHTGDVATLPLIPQCVDICKGHRSRLDNEPIAVVGAGGIFDGRGVAAALALGAQAAWVGTRFVAAKEAGASPFHQQAVLTSTSDDTIRTLIYSGRPMRILKTDYVLDWEINRREEAARLLSAGKRVHKNELARYVACRVPFPLHESLQGWNMQLECTFISLTSSQEGKTRRPPRLCSNIPPNIWSGMRWNCGHQTSRRYCQGIGDRRSGSSHRRSTIGF